MSEKTACQTPGCGRDTAPGFGRCMPCQATYTAGYRCSEGQIEILRDQFAMAALMGLVDFYSPEPAAQRAYECADAMLAARAKKP